MEIYKQQKLGEIQKNLMSRGNIYEAQDIQGKTAGPKPNIIKSAGQVAYGKAGPEGVTALKEEFRKTPQEWTKKGEEVAKGEQGYIDKALTLGGKFLSETGDVLGAGGRFVRHAIVSANENNVPWNPYAAASGGKAPGAEASDFRKWAETSPALAAKAYNAVGEVGGTVGGVVGTPIAYGFQALGSDKPATLSGAYKAAHDFSKDVTLDLATDPTNFIGVGGGKTAANATTQGAKMAAASGLKGAAAKQFAKEFAAEALTTGRGLGEIGGGRMLKQFAAGKGISEAAFNKVAGEAGEFVGKRGLNVLGQQVGNFEGGKLLGKMRELGAKKFDKLDILKLNPADRAAFLQSIQQTGGDIQRATEDKLKKIIEKLPEAKRAELLADKDKLAKWSEGFFDRVDPETGKKLKGLVGNYARGAERSFDASIADKLSRGLITEDEAYALSKEASKRLSGKVEPLINPKNELAQKALKGISKAHSGAADVIREGMFARPGYHLQNIKDDALLGWIAGGESFRGWSKALSAKKGALTDTLFKDELGRGVTKGEFLKELTDYGIVGGSDRLVEGSRKLVPGDIARGVTGESASTIPQKIGTVSNLGMNIPGKKLASKWDDSHRAALFAEFRQQGLPPKLAAQKVNDIAFNYADPGMFPGLLKLGKALNPFIGWGYRAASRVPKAALANPLRANLVPAMARNLGADAQFSSDEVPEYMKRNITATLPDSAKELINKGLKVVGMGSIPAGQGLKTTVREPTTGAIGVVDLAKEQGILGGPLANLGKTAFTGRNALGQESSVGTEALKLAGGSFLPVAAKVSSAKFGTANPFLEKDKVSPYPERDAAIAAARWATGETLIPTTGAEAALPLIFDEKQKERIRKLQGNKSTMTRAQIIAALKAQGRL
jgi:hypothetical protein